MASPQIDENVGKLKRRFLSVLLFQLRQDSNTISTHDILSSCKNILGPFDTYFERISLIFAAKT